MTKKLTDNLSISEYIGLIRAGYTAEQIEAEYGTATQPESPQEPEIREPEEQIKQPEQPADKPEQPADKPAEASNPSLDALLAEIKLLRGDIQKSNILTSSADIPKAPTAEQILATLIAPPDKEKGK